ncbi:MAG: MgtC/SapB family protein [Burkholderiales bacterium]|nr:MgtC/SapB family protein [Burkholderiales bacterium]
MLDSLHINGDLLEMAIRLVGALAIGALIGMERSYHGRPAGFRTHTLVCVASSLLMLVTVYESQWFVQTGNARVVVDPTRMAQGIMTGIGFLGAGVIMKDGLSVRGLTTAASIWITSAIGILVGIGFYAPAGIATVLTLGTLSGFRWIESKMPTEFYASFSVRFRRGSAMPEEELRALVSSHGFSIANLDYRLRDEGAQFEYRMILRTLKAENARALSESLNKLESVVGFHITPTGA